MESANSASATMTQLDTRDAEPENKTLVLKLRQKKVSWDNSAVNNEFMGKKSSKSNE
jgi:hypothetical protein